MRGSHGSCSHSHCSCSQENQENQERQETGIKQEQEGPKEPGPGQEMGPTGEPRLNKLWPGTSAGVGDRGARREEFQEVLHIQGQPGGRMHSMCRNQSRRRPRSQEGGRNSRRCCTSNGSREEGCTLCAGMTDWDRGLPLPPRAKEGGWFSQCKLQAECADYRVVSTHIHPRLTQMEAQSRTMS